MQFKVLRGLHSAGSAKGEDRKVYEAGDVVESDVDLVQRFGKEKFERVHEPVHAQPEPPRKSKAGA